MAAPRDHSVAGRKDRKPDLFLSHNAEDRELVRKLADDLALCEVDAWFDLWELKPSDPYDRVIAEAIGNSKFVGLCITENFSKSKGAQKELDLALARDRADNSQRIIPLLLRNAEPPVSVRDRIYVDFRSEYYVGLLRLVGEFHDLPRQSIEDAVIRLRPQSIRQVRAALDACGRFPYVYMSKEDVALLVAAGADLQADGRVHFSPHDLMELEKLPGRLRDKMRIIADSVINEGSGSTGRSPGPQGEFIQPSERSSARQQSKPSSDGFFARLFPFLKRRVKEQGPPPSLSS